MADYCVLVFQDILVCGTYKTSSTVEWALTELVRHPVVLEKIQTEMNEVVGFHRIVEETDLPQLPYLQVSSQGFSKERSMYTRIADVQRSSTCWTFQHLMLL